MAELLLELAGALDVVLLSTALRLDEHAETHLADHERIHRLGDLEARTNLAEQTRVLARADGLVSTYGGPAYLGSFLGVPTAGIASVANHNPRHLEAARTAAAAMGTRRRPSWTSSRRARGSQRCGPWAWRRTRRRQAGRSRAPAGECTTGRRGGVEDR